MFIIIEFVLQTCQFAFSHGLTFSLTQRILFNLYLCAFFLSDHQTFATHLLSLYQLMCHRGHPWLVCKFTSANVYLDICILLTMNCLCLFLPIGLCLLFICLYVPPENSGDICLGILSLVDLQLSVTAVQVGT